MTWAHRSVELDTKERKEELHKMTILSSSSTLLFITLHSKKEELFPLVHRAFLDLGLLAVMDA